MFSRTVKQTPKANTPEKGCMTKPGFFSPIRVNSRPTRYPSPPLTFLDGNLSGFFLPLTRIELLLIVVPQVTGQIPELFGTQLEIGSGLSLVPKNLVIELVTLGIVVHHEALVVCSGLVHHRAKTLKRGKHTTVVLENPLPVDHIWFSEDKNVVDIGAEIWRYS